MIFKAAEFSNGSQLTYVAEVSAGWLLTNNTAQMQLNTRDHWTRKCEQFTRKWEQSTRECE